MDADPVALAAEIQEAELAATVRVLSGMDPITGGRLVSRDLHHPDLARAGEWLEGELRAIDGLVVSRFPFPLDGIAPDPFDLVAELPGTAPGPVLLLGAHYDAIASSDPLWLDPATDPAPGADDDASGTAAILAIARTMAAWKPGFRHPVRFVLWSAEEYGLLGSQAYVDGLGPGEVEQMIQLDSIGYDANGAGNLWATFDPPSAALADSLVAFAAEAGTPLALTPVPAELVGGDARSDHYPFWEVGIPAIHLASFPLPPTYHTMGDTLDAVDLPFALEATRLVAGFAIAEAQPLEGAVSAPPTGCGCGPATPHPWWAAALGFIAWRRSTTRSGSRRGPADPPRSADPAAGCHRVP